LDAISQILHLCRMLDVMTAGSRPTWLGRILRLLRAAIRPTRDDRARLMPAETLLDLAFSLMERAESSPSPSMRLRAVMYRDGLMLAVLLGSSLRLGNLANLRLGHSLMRRGEEWWIAYEARSVKGKRRPIDQPIPAELAPMIDHYIRFWRPVLMQRPGELHVPSNPDAGFLWVGRYGGRFGPKKINKRINVVTFRELGHAMNPHLFRKLPPTELAIHDPAHVGVSQAVLSHASYDTTQKAYNLAQSLDAARKVQSQLATLRGESQRKKVVETNRGS